MADHSREENSSQAAGKKFTALFTVRRWLRATPCTAAQASVLFAMASFAQPEGTGIHPGIDDLAELTKLDRKTVIGALKVWRAADTITRTKAGNRRARQADEYKINLDWQPSKVAADHFCKSDPTSPLKSPKVEPGTSKVESNPQKWPRATPSEKTFSEKTLSSKKEGAAQTAAPGVPSIAIPTWMPLLQWSEYLKYREQRKKPLTPYAQQLAVKSLTDLRASGHDPAEVIERSILNAWMGFFPPRSSAFGPAGRTREEQLARVRKNAITLGLDKPN